MNKKIALLTLLALLLPNAAFAQGEANKLRLGLDRNFGYGGFGEIQGSFTLKILDPPDSLKAVDFYLDGEAIASTPAEPFQYKFHTGDFPEGMHLLSAAGYLADGTRLESNQISTTFLSSEDAWSQTGAIITPILIGTAVLTLLGIGFPLLLNRPREFVLGKYGPAGGAVCPRCQLPFSRSLLAPNLLAGKLVRCPHCGKISLQARASLSSLQRAEARFLGQEHGEGPGSEEGELKRLIEDSRYEE